MENCNNLSNKFYRSTDRLFDLSTDEQKTVICYYILNCFERFSNQLDWGILKNKIIGDLDELFSANDNELYKSRFKKVIIKYHRLMLSYECKDLGKVILSTNEKNKVSSALYYINRLEYNVFLDSINNKLNHKITSPVKDFCNETKKFLSNVKDAPSIQKNNSDSSFNKPKSENQKVFEDLFKEKFKPHINQFIQVLKNLDPPLLNSDNEWIGYKHAAKTFLYCLRSLSVIDSIKDKPAAEIFSSKFPGLGTFFLRNQKGNKVHDNYGSEKHGPMIIQLEILISKINSNLKQSFPN
ncbi:hypothetical protein [Mucilaginibacter paludis]|uniref:Uncharacterized protein n=1 Tax=Mucilaginibacter paludis DSM 18603 TaxID=714943 RepID=H1Y7C5_9SPHI|nr:hypothetical protein [Mucilaginibacter paludis]EHQ29012.1 hypothetical protein Mucpa_4928 [Mucilaginibacter paludis DSM 18603]